MHALFDCELMDFQPFVFRSWCVRTLISPPQWSHNLFPPYKIGKRRTTSQVSVIDKGKNERGLFFLHLQRMFKLLSKFQGNGPRCGISTKKQKTNHTDAETFRSSQCVRGSDCKRVCTCVPPPPPCGIAALSWVSAGKNIPSFKNFIIVTK